MCLRHIVRPGVMPCCDVNHSTPTNDTTQPQHPALSPRESTTLSAASNTTLPRTCLLSNVLSCGELELEGGCVPDQLCTNCCATSSTRRSVPSHAMVTGWSPSRGERFHPREQAIPGQAGRHSSNILLRNARASRVLRAHAIHYATAPTTSSMSSLGTDRWGCGSEVLVGT